MNPNLPLITDQFKNTWVENKTSDEYHADKTAIGSTSLKAILESPLAFLAAIKSPPDEDNDALRFGRAAHQAFLEPDEFRRRMVAQPDFGDLRTKEAKQFKARWTEDLPPGVTVVTKDELDTITGIINSIAGHKHALGLVKGARPEISGYFRDEKTGILCKFRPDLLHTDLTALTDFKTTRSCGRKKFSDEIFTRKYYFQMAFYREGVKAITGKYPDTCAWLAAEKTDPYDVAVYYASEAMIEKGEKAYRYALDKLKECMTTGVWHGKQPDGIEPIDLPYYTTFSEEY